MRRLLENVTSAGKQRRVLQLLASIPFGASEAVMLTHGFTRRTLADLMHAGLAAAERSVAKAADKAIAAGRVKITGAGRKALGANNGPEQF